MSKVTYVSSKGQSTTVDVLDGDSIMEGAVQNNVDGIVGACGGCLQCATCHVYVDEGFLGKLDEIEAEEEVMLQSTAADRKPNSRLSCQIRLRPDLNGITVTMPDSQ
jgi:ferredoxin, 2Fe-2S